MGNGSDTTEQFPTSRGALTQDAFLQVYCVFVHQLHSFSTNSINPQPTDESSELEAHSVTPPREVQDNFRGQKLEGDPLVCCKLHVQK